MQHMGVREEDEMVILVVDGKRIELPWQVAESIGKTLMQASRGVRDREDHVRLIQEQAIAMKSALPFLLTKEKDIVKEAVVEAQWGVLHSLPMVRSDSRIFAPAVKRG